MTSSKWFDTKDEADSFCMGLSLGGRHEYFTRQSDKRWEVKYWTLWNR